jgi:hypothetical protein
MYGSTDAVEKAIHAACIAFIPAPPPNLLSVVRSFTAALPPFRMTSTPDSRPRTRDSRLIALSLAHDIFSAQTANLYRR